MHKRYLIIALWVIATVGCTGSSKSKRTIVSTPLQFDEVMARVVDAPADISPIFPKTADDVKRYLAFSKELAKKELSQVLAIHPKKRTFDNTVRALDDSQAKIKRFASALEFLSMLSPDDTLRKAAHGASVALSQFAVETYMTKPIYQAFLDYQTYEGKAEKLTKQEQYCFDESMKAFVREGFALPDKEFVEIKALQKEIAELELAFQQNINTDASSIEATKEQLAGIDPVFFEKLKKKGELFVVGCDYPTYFEVMENCRVTDTRKRLYKAFNNRAYPANVTILEKLIEKRDTLAKKLGFKSFAHLDIAPTMAQTPERVEKFLIDLTNAAGAKAMHEYTVFKENLPEGVTLDEKRRFYPWDLSYVKNAYKKQLFNVDEREIAEYFPVDSTLKGMLGIYEKFLGLRFKVIKPDWVWHEDVQLVQVDDKRSGKLLGYIFLDLYPRANKYGHACCGAVVKGYYGKDAKTHLVRDVPYVGVVVANFPKATADKPALLKHENVETFFHEFGHAMHGVLGRAELSSAAGTSVKLDFVELPSQMLEEWMWDKDILQNITSHYKTGGPLPNKLLEAKLALKKFGTGRFVLGQTYFSFISLDYHLEGAKKNTDHIIKRLHEQFFAGEEVFDKEVHRQASFGHLAGYSSRYYGYMWSRVFALDCFSKIKKYGLLSYEIGEKWRNGILGMGGAADPNDLLKEFLGREPNQEAFLRDLGFK